MAAPVLGPLEMFERTEVMDLLEKMFGTWPRRLSKLGIPPSKRGLPHQALGPIIRYYMPLHGSWNPPMYSYRSIAEEDSYRVCHSLLYISRSFGFFLFVPINTIIHVSPYFCFSFFSTMYLNSCMSTSIPATRKFTTPCFFF